MSTDNNLKQDLQENIEKRIREYEDLDSSNEYSMYVHIRAVISFILKSRVGEGLSKGNKLMTEEQYNESMNILNDILPSKTSDEN